MNWIIKNCLNEWTDSLQLISSPLSVNISDWVYNEKKNKNLILLNPIKCPTTINSYDMEGSRRQNWPVQYTHRWDKASHRALGSPLLDSPSLTLWWLCHAWWLGWVYVLLYHTKDPRRRQQMLHYWKMENKKSVNWKPHLFVWLSFFNMSRTKSLYLIRRQVLCLVLTLNVPSTLWKCCFNLKSFSEPWITLYANRKKQKGENNITAKLI